MNAYPGWETGAGWLLNHSWQAGLLVVMVLAVQYAFRGRLTNRWRFILWWIVLGRLLLPFSPSSALSVFNYISPTRLTVHHEAAVPFNSASVEPFATAPITTSPAETHSLNNQVSAPSAIPVAPDLSEHPQIAAASAGAGKAQLWQILSSKPFWYFALLGIWLVGVLVLAGVIVTQVWRFNRRLMRDVHPAEERLQRLLDQCRGDFGLSRPVELLETRAVQSPALFGLFRPRLLLPRGIGDQFSERELRYIFLHELAHIQRGDLWLNWLVAGLQTLHWFNPLLWFGFARLRADRELACDELALLQAGDHAGTAYGETVVKLLEHLNRPAVVPGLIGVLEDKKQMRRRIAMIARFRKPGRWSVLALLLVLAVAAAGLTDAQSTKPATVTEADRFLAAPNLSGRLDLRGSVTVQNGGKLPVTATVFVEAAGPKTGTSTFCPYCYVDCSKRVQTDGEGHFKIESLDPQLKFRLLVVAKGYQPTRVADVDPMKGEAVKVELKPIESVDAALDRSVRGKIVDSKGEPIADAVVDVEGVETKNGGGMWGVIAGVDPLAVTNEKGEFLITSRDSFAGMTVTVSARQYADRKFNLTCGDTPHVLTMTEGASLKGRVMLDGQPLAGTGVGVSGTDRTSGNFLGHFEVATDAGGHFKFFNLPPGGDFQIYTLMDSMKGKGAPALRQIRTGTDGETTDAGNLNVLPGHRLAGRVVLADGNPVPNETRLLISRDAAWDSTQVTLDENGSFDTQGIPDERMVLSVRVNGYHISGKNFSLDPLNSFRLIGRMDRDVTNLVILMDKGPDLNSSWQNLGSEYEELQQHTLCGAEAVSDHSREWLVTGQVWDADTKEPIAQFTVMPGEARPWSGITWDRRRASSGTNGTYTTYVNKHIPHAQLRADADGYLPAAVELPSQDASNVDFYLHKGIGPAGTVLNPDGQPASGAKVVYVGTGLNEASIDVDGKLQAQTDKSTLRTVDAQGHFSFSPELEKTHLVAMSTNGFAMVRLEAFATNPVIRLEPFGHISGTLKRTSGPGANEVLDLALAGGNVPHLNMSYRADTDDHGHFEFNNVPATRLEVTSRIGFNNDKTFAHGWQTEDLQTVDLKPGQTLEVNVTAADREKPTETSTYTAPQPKLIPGEQIKGIVLRPNGEPAAGTDVALQVEGKYLNLGKGEFVSNNLRQEGLIVTTGPDGSFTLPMYDKVQSVIALNEDGFARVSLDEIKSSPQVKLQKWGRIEGTVYLGHHLGTNEIVSIDAAPVFLPPSRAETGQTNQPLLLQPLNYDINAFECRTDDQGRFAFAFVPPGEQRISRQVPMGGGSSFSHQLAMVEVPPGGTVVTNVGGDRQGYCWKNEGHWRRSLQF